MRTRRAMHAIPRAGQPEEIGEAARLPGLRRGELHDGAVPDAGLGYTVR